jgi:hypothetical protein
MAISEERRAYKREWQRRNREHVKAYRAETRDRRNALRRERYAANPALREQIKRESTEWKRRNRLRIKARQYGVDIDELELAMDRGCAVCGANPHQDPTTRLHVDHDHRSGKFRGVLCQPCNLALGHIQDDPAIATALADYLMRGASDGS